MKIIVKNPTSSNIRTGVSVTPQSVTDITEARGAVSVDEAALSLCVASSVASELEDSYYTVSGIELKGNFMIELDGDLQPHIFNVELIRQYLHDLQILTAITTDTDSAIIGFTSKTEKTYRLRLYKTISSSVVVNGETPNVSVKDEYVDFFIGGRKPLNVVVPSDLQLTVTDSNRLTWSNQSIELTEQRIYVYLDGKKQLLSTVPPTQLEYVDTTPYENVRKLGYSIDSVGHDESLEIVASSDVVEHKYMTAEFNYLCSGSLMESPRILIEGNIGIKVDGVSVGDGDINTFKNALLEKGVKLDVIEFQKPIIVEHDYNIETTGTASFNLASALGEFREGKVMIDWGDGKYQHLTLTSQPDYDDTRFVEYTYSEPGIYQIKIYDTDILDRITILRSTALLDWGEDTPREFNFRGSYFKRVPNYLPSSFTSLSSMFQSTLVFNDPNVAEWDTSNITNMANMFAVASIFNQDISGWDTSNVTTMRAMFRNATNFNQDLSQWDTSNVTDMSEMFEQAKAFNGDISTWDTSNVTNMFEMFFQAVAFNQPIGSWNTSNVTDMTWMFSDASIFNQDISMWDVSNVTAMRAMFQRASVFNQDLSNWNTSKVTDMAYMFNNALAFNKPLNTWNTSSVTDMSAMFQKVAGFNQPLNDWDVSNVTDMSYMFNGATAFNGNVSTWNTGNVTTMRTMFQNATAFNQDVSSWNVSKVADMAYMFLGTSNYIYSLAQWCVPLITSRPTSFNATSGITTAMSPVWGTCPRLEIIAGQENDPDVLYFTTNASGSISYTGLTGAAGDRLVTSAGRVIYNFSGNTIPAGKHQIKLASNRSTGSITLSSSRITEVHNFPTINTVSNIRLGSTSLVKVPTYLPPNITDTTKMFFAARTFNQDISMWDTSNVTNMTEMFIHCNIFNQPIGNWNTSKVTNMNHMFYEAFAFNQPLDNWDTSKVTDMSFLFQNARAFNQDITGWDVSNVTNMTYMFDAAWIFNQDIGNWNVSKVTNMDRLFYNAKAFNQDLSQWCVGRITTTPYQFSDYSPLSSNYMPVWGTCPVKPEDDEIPSNEMHFTTLAGSIVYVGTQGDQILLSDGTTVDVTVTDQMFEFNVPAGKHKVVLVESIDRSNFVSVSGGALVELHNFPALSTVTKFNFSTINSPNLTKVPEFFPSNITDIENMFGTTENFNQDISMWDVSNVKIFDYAFATTQLFNQPLNTWDVSGATSMRGLFESASSFNQDISMWDTSKVTDMAEMFEFATNFNQPIGNWDVSKVTDMNSMFCMASAFDQPIGEWNVSNVTDMAYMFDTTANFNQDISGWDVSNVTSMYSMFDGAATFNSDLSGWNVSNVTSMVNMFRGAATFNSDLSGWDTSKVTDMSRMFRAAIAFNQDLSQWCVPLIASLPSDFATDAPLFTADKLPVWGTCPVKPEDDEIPSNEMHFITTAGTIDYYGVVGDQIVLNDGTTVILEDDSKYDITVPSGKHKLVLVETRSQDYVGLGGEALVEINNFPTLSSVNTIDTCPNNSSPNLVKVPTTLPSNITHIQYMFSGATSFNQDISMWDTSSVTNMTEMFYNASVFNQDISGWNVSNVKRMNSMFYNASVFNQDISGWNVSNVTDMDGMFQSATSFNQDLSQWCVADIAYPPMTFDHGATNWTLPRPVWGTCPRGENIPDSDYTKAVYVQTDTSNIASIAAEYDVVDATGKLLIDWGDGNKEIINVANYTDSGYYFKITHPYLTNGEYTIKVYSTTKAKSLELGEITAITDWGNPVNLQLQTYSNVLTQVPSTLHPAMINLTNLFNEATIFNQDISGWDTSNVTSMSALFSGAVAFNQPIGNWDVSNVTDMSGMFSGATIFNQDISGWDTSKVTDMLWMFESATSFNQDLSQWCVPLISSLPSSFATKSALIADNFPVWGTCPTGENQVPADEFYFTTTTGSLSYRGAAGDVITLSDGNTFTVIDGNVNTYTVPAGKHKVKLVSVRSGYVGLAGGTLVEIHNFPTIATINNIRFRTNINSPNLVKVPTTLPSNLSDLTKMFYNASTFNQDISGWDVSNVTNLSYTFAYATAFDQPLDQWNTSNVTDMSFMFAYCDNFNQPIGSWNTDNVTNLSYTFAYATAFDQPIGTWDVSKVVDMGGAFYVATAFNQDISAWNTSNVTNMQLMFSGAKAFDVNISDWNVSNVIDMSYMFNDASTFNQDISGWDVSNVTNMVGMFAYCDNFNQPIGSWNTSNVTNMNQMFEGALLFNQDISQWCVGLISTMPGNFSLNGSLSTVNHPVWGTCPRGENLV